MLAPGALITLFRMTQLYNSLNPETGDLVGELGYNIFFSPWYALLVSKQSTPAKSACCASYSETELCTHTTTDSSMTSLGRSTHSDGEAR